MAATNTKLWYLENFNLFEGMSEKEMKMVETITHMKTINKDQFIYFPETPSSSVFFLKKGRVKIVSYSEDGKEIIKKILWPGEIFGELGLIDDELKRTDFSQAMDDDVLICAMDKDEMVKMMSMNTKLNIKVMKLIGLRLRRVERRVESLICKSARTRLVEFIKELAEERGKKVGTETLIKHHLTHQDIANLNAISRQKTTSIMNELRDENIINFDRNSILVRDLNKLN
ncbi:MAG: Crp/Fnr family transcriptional regulator [Bacteroidetes bacterium]|nr:MAG: Crp/Fnr family transcriptional regulator [Bacteroidota bacterium]